MKISVRLEVSENNGYHTFDLDDLNVTKEEWEKMDYSEQIRIIEMAVFNLPEQPYWTVESFYEKQ